ncbi:MAG TPA: DNA-directed RNA polymerase subunit RpoH/Rpb5 C-terminal domain-containing protein [Candidatus Saccharimonadales bacterium]|nr:DNA-directed RNA polymerase subunit RpoH/Rpb5 C-terminal domain-containing protein [Candidatus Saccharimonadales bacterium]
MNDLLMVKKTQIEMVRDRNYIINDDELLILNDRKVKNITYNQSYQKMGDDEQTLYVQYCLNMTPIDIMKTFVKQMKTHTVGIIIGSDDDLNTLHKKTYQEYFDQLKLKSVQLFNYDELYFNITQHVFSPIYERIDKDLIIPTIAHANQLPVLLKNDPIVKYYHFPAGSVIKVTEELFMDSYISVQIRYCIVTNQIKV